jgi:hypothetical protein
MNVDTWIPAIPTGVQAADFYRLTDLLAEQPAQLVAIVLEARKSDEAHAEQQKSEYHDAGPQQQP